MYCTDDICAFVCVCTYTEKKGRDDVLFIIACSSEALRENSSKLNLFIYSFIYGGSLAGN